MKLLLSTSYVETRARTLTSLTASSNLLGGSSVVYGSGNGKSNQELISALRSNFEAHSQQSEPVTNGASDVAKSAADYKRWTRQEGDTLEVPSLASEEQGLDEERDQYDITLKLFFLPGSFTEQREAQTREALQRVSQELHIPSVDLLIVSFPGIYFDESDDDPDKAATRGPIECDPEALQTQVDTWRVLEEVQKEGLVKKLGVAEFGRDRLEAFLGLTSIQPSVNQINLRDCCSVPKDLLVLAKSHKIELLVHNDCSDILPKGTTRDLLGPEGAALLAPSSSVGEKRKDLHDTPAAVGISGEVHPQWVVKYTAVVRNRGVVENKGYFAVAEIKE